MNLVAVQARMTLEDYRDEAAFRRKADSLMVAASRAVDFSLPTLVSFPELIGMYLAFVPYFWDELAGERSLERAATAIVMRHIGEVPEEFRTSPEAAARYLLFVRHAIETERAYAGVFSSLAREYGAYVGAGSIALPPMEYEPSKGLPHAADPSRLYNTAYLFSPRGVCLARTPKVYLTAGLEERLFDPGPRSEVYPVHTALGRVGTLVCFDGFHETLVERLDALGTEVLLKPSYNMHAWQGPSTYDPSRREGENWLRTGCPAVIQGRENIRYGVNAMLVGAVFEDTAAEGISTIAVNTGRPGCWEEGIIARAGDPAREEIVAATVEAS